MTVTSNALRMVDLMFNKTMNDPQKLEIKVALKMLKPIAQVFEAITDPAQMCNYFIATSSGRMIEGAILTWTFPEMDTAFPVRIKRVVDNELILYSWDDMEGVSTDVEITFKAMSEAETFVTIREGIKENTESGLRWLKSNTEGWANFLCCLKAWVEHGINLRKGAFAPSQMPS